MSANTRFMPFPPEAIFAILADADLYREWVVGATATFETDPRWPEMGSSFVHQQGFGRLHLTDTTTVTKVDPPTRIEMEARAQPLVIASVAMTLAKVADGSLVRMEETITGGLLRPLADVLDRLVHHRNARALERLEKLTAGMAQDQGRAAARAAA
jgi:uncharacterized protein YndB with AHSA1/START domain